MLCFPLQSGEIGAIDLALDGLDHAQDSARMRPPNVLGNLTGTTFYVLPMWKMTSGGQQCHGDVDNYGEEGGDDEGWQGG